MSERPSKSNNNKKENIFKKIISHPLIIFGSIITISLIGTGVYYYSNGGSVGLNHKMANQKYTTQKKSQKEIFKEHHTDNYPTIEEVKDKLKSQFKTDNLTKLSITQIDNAIKKDYSNKVLNLILQGNLLSQNMTPDQADQAEINIERVTRDTSQYVGYSKYKTGTNLYQNNITTNDTKLQFGPIYSYDDQVHWNKLNNLKVSQPFISGTQSNNIVGANVNVKNTSQVTLIMFVQVNNATSWQNVVSQMKNLEIKVDNKDIKLAGNNNTTYYSKAGIYGKGYGLQLARNTKFDFSKSNKIYTNSIIPICYDVPVSQKDYNKSSFIVSIPSINTYQLNYESTSNIDLN